MSKLFGSLLRWAGRNFLSFLLIVAVLVVANFAQQELREYVSVPEQLGALKRGKDGLIETLGAREREVATRVSSFEKASLSTLGERIAALDQEILQRSSPRPSTPDPKWCVLSAGDACERFIDALRLDAEIQLLEQERDYLRFLHGVATDQNKRLTGYAELERLRRVHVGIFDALQANQAAQAQLRAGASAWEWINPLAPKAQQLRALTRAYDDLLASNQQAHADWVRQNRLLEALKLPAAWRPFVIRRDAMNAMLAQLDREISRREQTLRENWVARFNERVIHVVPTALGILLALLLVPVMIKALLYFVVAPLAARRPAVILLPGVSGESIELAAIPEAFAGSDDRIKVSAVSQTITIDATQELLVHPEYLQSSASDATKHTRWLLDWTCPLSSLAAGLYGLTRLRTSGCASFVVSATQDPFSEIGLVNIAEGSALVFQPHSLIGVVQSTDRPLRITRHWRLGSLHAWLTLQLRFLVFHGPVTLLVSGCRGVRIERAGNGRSINQAATIGFSANLEYSTTRCETFAAYLLGKQELFNDQFGGGPGYYLYEEMPHFGKKTGLTGRGVEGLSDSLLKVFGV